MEDLLTSYTIAEIALFVVMLGLAVKGVVSFYDWAHDRLKKWFTKEHAQEEMAEDIETEKSELQTFQDKVEQEFADQDKKIREMENENNLKIEQLGGKVDMLIESDRDAILAYITEKHHYFVYEKGYIDYHSLECLEKRYDVYRRKEGGNSFAASLMDDIRELPQDEPPKSAV